MLIRLQIYIIIILIPIASASALLSWKLRNAEVDKVTFEVSGEACGSGAWCWEDMGLGDGDGDGNGNAKHKLHAGKVRGEAVLVGGYWGG